MLTRLALGITFFAAAAAAAGGCAHGPTPPSVRSYAADLPARADGQYALLDDPIKKQLVMKDSELQCKIDLEDSKDSKKTEAESAACRCTKSASADWKQDCKDWLGSHVPKA